MGLLQKDFEKDTYMSVLLNVKVDHLPSVDSRSQMAFAYRLAKYAQYNKSNTLTQPIRAMKIFLNEMNVIRRNDYVDILSLLLDYVVCNSYLMTMSDISRLFGEIVAQQVDSLIAINKIVNSRANITTAKQKKYTDQFTHNIMMIKAAIVIAELRSLTLNALKGFPAKIHTRYLPIFDAYPEVGDFVAAQLKKWLLTKLQAAQRSDKEDYKLTSGDLFKYFAIIKDQRLQSTKFNF